MPLEFSPDQIEAKRLIDVFLDDPKPSRPWFELEGIWGTGKSYLLAAIARERKNAVLCAYTGKAASNLSRRIGRPAVTIHSAIMSFRGRFVEDDGTENIHFKRRVADNSWRGKLALLDEKGIVGEDLAKDLLATGCRIVAAGDPGQLRPVRGRQFFDTPDFTLTEIHRQALESPIVRQAHAVRRGLMYQPDGPAFRVQRNVEHEDIVACDIILCWRNETRRQLNALKRAHLGIEGPPRPGEPVMCLKNDHELGILNGAIYALERFEQVPERGVTVGLVNERDEYVEVRRAWFEDFDESMKPRDDSIGFCIGHCATVHKFQGSEAAFVILVDDYSGADRDRWLGTAISRASERILVQRSW
jgi:exodeoxyribonuclease-5